MKRRIYILTLLSLFFLCFKTSAQCITLNEARCVADSFFQAHSLLNFSEVDTTRTYGNRNTPTMYVFSIPNNWVLVAGDKRVQPILAYSEVNGGDFPMDENIPPAMWELLEWYSSQIEELRNRGVNQVYNPLWQVYLNNQEQTIRALTSIVVEPLLRRDGHENVWKQSNNNEIGGSVTKSYNKFCPAVHDNIQDCDHALAGCVAVAMGQIMWYWMWPHAAIVKDDNNNNLIRNYDWSLMPYKLTNSSEIEQADMISNLLHDIGVSVSMEYGCLASGTSPLNVTPALNTRFYYATDSLKYRNSYSNNTWISFIKSELNALRPVLYGGENLGGEGHQYVIDGYNTDNKFHINYGMGDLSINAYYSMDTITFNINQTMVMNIRPNISCLPITIPSSNIWNTLFLIQNGGEITIGDRIVSSGMQGEIISGESVTLTNGFKVEAGAKVSVYIKDMHCDDERESVTHLINDQRVYRSQKLTNPNDTSTRKMLQNGQLFIERDGKTYTITGQEVK